MTALVETVCGDFDPADVMKRCVLPPHATNRDHVYMTDREARYVHVHESDGKVVQMRTAADHIDHLLEAHRLPLRDRTPLKAMINGHIDLHITAQTAKVTL